MRQCTCGQKFHEPAVYPVHCRCGALHDECAVTGMPIVEPMRSRRPVAATACWYRSAIPTVIPRDVLDCGCGQVDLYQCGRFGESVTLKSLRSSARATLIDLDVKPPKSRDQYRGRTCADCPHVGEIRTPVRRPKLPRDATRVVFAFPSLHWAGVEQWLVSLLVALQRIGGPLLPFVALTGECDAELLVKLRTLCDVRQGDDCRDLVAAADVAVVWSLNSIPWWLAGFDGPIIGVSHGCADWWMREAVPWVDKWVAVAHAATIPCPGPATVLHNGCDADRLRPTMPRNSARTSLALSETDIGIGILARLSVEKRHEEAITRWRLLPDNYRLVIVGDGAREAELRTLAAPLGTRVVWAGVRHDVANVYHGLDATLSLSSHEGFGLSVVESVLAGLPTVATPVGIVPELPRLLGGRQPVDVLPQLDDLPGSLTAAVERGRRDASGLDYLTADAMARRWADYLAGV